MSISLGLIGLLLLGFLLISTLPWVLRSVGESLSEFRKKPGHEENRNA